MESVKKWLSERKNNGLYVHRSPPKLVGAIPAAQLRQWARGGSESRLERLVLAGQGRRLLSEACGLPISHHLPSLVAKCDALHAAVEKGSLLELQELLHPEYNRQKYVTCKDEAGVGLLHKAVYYDFTDITEWLVENFPQLVHQRDSTGRTPLHYAVLNRNEASTASLLEGAGARAVRDEAGRTPASYRGAARTLLTLPRKTDMPPVIRRPGQMIKRHQIRIWCHDCDMARLQRIVWEGHGTQLLSEVSNQPVVKKFLEAVPYMMNTIRDIHTAVVQNDLEGIMRLSGDPVPPQILSSRDINNMTVMHKAAGLGHCGILKYIAERYPEGVNDIDNDGRTPLHYAAAVRDEQHTFNTLVELGADESVVDNKNKTPGYYVNRAHEIDKNLLKVIPDAPRTASSAYPSSWDWKLLDTEVIAQLNKKSRRKNKGSSENISSKNNTNTISENTESRTMKTSSTHELIKDLPELDESKIQNKETDAEDEDPQTEDHPLEEVTENGDSQDENEHVEEDNKREASEENNTLDENDDESQTEIEPGDEIQADNEEPKETDEPNQEENVDGEEDKVIEENETTKDEDNQTDSEQNIENETNNAEINTSDNEEKDNEENEDTKPEGNINGEDDDDVQVPGDTNSEYSDIHLKSTAEASNTGSAERGNLTNGRNTQESLIEGIISGEAEQDSQDASITQNDGSVHGDVLVVDSEIDPEVTELINTANMEMLATLVLNGEGARLLGRSSGNTELQAFLDNVPTYMQKIKNVHTAAKEGNIRNLQAALDRRKFAIARDPISANGATPLHIATIFGKTNIMKYLGGRFPETLSAVDFEGRTALHYAAVLPDNGHYYSLLQQLGANSKDLDDNGNSAADYLGNPSLLPLTQLLSDFGLNEEDANNMFSDKVPGDLVSSRRSLDTPEASETLERCYRLLASAKPARTPLSASSNKTIPPVVLGRFLKRHVFDTIKNRITKMDHDLFDVIWPAVKKLPDNRNILQTVEEDFPGGITAPDYYVYEVFNEFLIPLVKDLHNINVHSELPQHPPTDFVKHKLSASSKTSEHLVELNIDPNDMFVLSGTIECTRNVHGFELPLNLSIGKLEAVERILTTILMQDEFSKLIEHSNPESDQKGGSYYTLNEVLERPSEVSATLASSGLLVALCDKEEIDDSMRLHGKHWPYGRGVYVSEDKTVAIWINVHDHLRVLISTPSDSPGEIGLTYSKLSHIMSYLHERIGFVWDSKLGHLCSRPTYLGVGMRISLIVNFPGLSKDLDNIKNLCDMRGLQYRETLSAHIARISNYQSLATTETNCFNDFATATSNLLHLERDLSMQSSAHIASMLTNIFRRKRSSLAELDSPEKHS